MKSFALAAAAVLLARLASAVPTDLVTVKRAADASPTVTQILQFALTLEHLENAFYAGGLAKYDENDFTDGGLPDWARGRFVQIGEHEASHVQFLTAALGNAAPAPCTYSL